MNDYNFELNKQALLFYIYATGFVRLENGRGILMISRTKYDITREKIKEIFEKAGIHGAHGIEPQLI